jgi:hypothetical protein
MRNACDGALPRTPKRCLIQDTHRPLLSSLAERSPALLSSSPRISCVQVFRPMGGKPPQTEGAGPKVCRTSRIHENPAAVKSFRRSCQAKIEMSYYYQNRDVRFFGAAIGFPRCLLLAGKSFRRPKGLCSESVGLRQVRQARQQMYFLRKIPQLMSGIVIVLPRASVLHNVSCIRNKRRIPEPNPKKLQEPSINRNEHRISP